MILQSQTVPDRECRQSQSVRSHPKQGGLIDNMMFSRLLSRASVYNRGKIMTNGVVYFFHVIRLMLLCIVEHETTRFIL